jgi:long-chain acyl-CoA synthetase
MSESPSPERKEEAVPDQSMPSVRTDVFAEPDPSLLMEGSFITQLETVRRRAGDRVAVMDQDRSVTYEELWRTGSAVAGWLAAQGCRSGDRICIDQPNGVAWVESFLGVLLAGCVAVPLDQKAPQAHRDGVRKDAGARLTLSELPGLDVNERLVTRPALDDLAVLLFTSGSTGRPKGVMITHRNVASYQRITAAYLRLEPDRVLRNLVAIPLWHSAGLNTQLLPTLALGGTVLLAPGAGPESVLSSLELWRPDLIFAVPVVYQRLLDATQRDRTPLRCLTDVHFGAATASRRLIRDLREALPWARLGNAFGMTEISNVALFLPHDHLDDAEGSIGFPVPGVECEIRDTDDAGRGALYLRGPNLAAGYWGGEELSAVSFGAGWIRSGDVAEIGPGGAVYLRDRMDDVINRGGEKIYSTAVEEALLALPGVLEAAVVAVPDDELGARVGAVLVTETEYDHAQLRTLLRDQLPRYAIPEVVRSHRLPLPRGSSGKVIKTQVLQQLRPDAE